MFYATAVSQPSHHPQFIVITVFEEAIRNPLKTGLVDSVLFGGRPELERLHPKDSLLYITDDVIESEPNNTGSVIQALQREVTGCVNQMTLAELLCSRSTDNHTVFAALSEYYHYT